MNGHRNWYCISGNSRIIGKAMAALWRLIKAAT
jgi:hypothetical protein